MKLTEDIKPVTYATLLLQLTAQGEAEVQLGRVVPQEEAFNRARRRLSQKKPQP